jgi:hypothetical protein
MYSREWMARMRRREARRNKAKAQPAPQRKAA